MCGIGGIFFQRQTSADLLVDRAQRIARRLNHRGPDDSGYWIDSSVGIAFAHTRLSIVDLSEHGHQPMISHNGRYALSYNGEIYNHQDLRDELRSTGTEFNGHSDTEVVLEYIAHFGLKQALAKFNGMFAIALWDREEKCLYLIRDRVGIKPLYYGCIRGTWIFASELKAFSRIPERPQKINVDALGVFMRHGYVTDDVCIFQGMHKVAAGSIVRIPFESGRCSAEQFWSLRDVVNTQTPCPSGLDELGVTNVLHQELKKAVSKRMVADVPVGAFLSGGVDSSLIVSLMQEHSSASINTFTIGFKEKRYDESLFAEKVAAKLGTNHTTLTIEATDVLDLLYDLPEIYDEPFADSSQLPTILVSRFAAKQVKVVLSGDGGDELFGGYTRYRKMARLWQATRRVPYFLRQPLAASIRRLSRSSTLQSRGLRLSATLCATDSVEFYLAGISMLHDASRLVRGANNVIGRFKDAATVKNLNSIEERMMYTDFVNYLPGDILTKVDRASMSTGLEVRVPLLDHDFIETVWSVPWAWRGRSDFSKQLLKNILYRYLDQSLFNRPKSGFSIPLSSWLRGPMKEWAEHLLSSQATTSDQVFDHEALKLTWKKHLLGEERQTNILWNALVFLSWREAWCADEML